MGASLLLLFKFGYDIVKRMIHDAYFRVLGTVLMLMVTMLLPMLRLRLR